VEAGPEENPPRTVCTVVTASARAAASLSETTVTVTRAEAGLPDARQAKTGTETDSPALTATSAFCTPAAQPASSTATDTR
jgi:hypothetical protein